MSQQFAAKVNWDKLYYYSGKARWANHGYDSSTDRVGESDRWREFGIPELTCLIRAGGS
jgi:hypothetical protein